MSRLYKIILGVMLFVIPALGFADLPPQYYSVTVSGRVRDTAVTFIGFSSPNAFITIQEDAAVVATFSANTSGGFNRTLSARTPGTHAYGIFAQDEQGRTTPTYGFILNLASNMETVVSNILLPTTIDVTVGQKVNIYGAAAPNTQVTIFVHSNPFNETASADGNGNWNKQIATYMDPGAHDAYARLSSSGGLQSVNSHIINFNVTCKIADLNCDGRVDLIDFSILMFYWGTNNSTADINTDGTVDLVDFSIMMFYWEG